MEIWLYIEYYETDATRGVKGSTHRRISLN